MNDISDDAEPAKFANDLDEEDEQNETHSFKTGMTENAGFQAVKEGLMQGMADEKIDKSGTPEPMDTSEDGFVLVPADINEDLSITTPTQSPSRNTFPNDFLILNDFEGKLNAEEQRVRDMGDPLRKKTEEMEQKNKTEVLEHNTKKQDWENEKAELQRSLEEEKQKVKETEIFWENEIKQIKQTNENECENLHKRQEELEKSLSKMEEDNTAWQNRFKQLEQNKERELNQKMNEWYTYCNALNQQYTKEKEHLLNTIQTLKAEKDNLLTRLSRIAADRLTHENVNITDLSDADRPTKLQEVYSQLYDNVWTDAFEELTEQKVPEKDAIMILLDILMSSFQKCREITRGRYERLKYVASSVDIVQRNPLPSTEKVMSNVCEPGLVKQEAESRAQMCNKNTKDDQNVATENVESGDPNVSAASKDKFENEKEKRLECTVDLSIDLEKQIKDIWRKTTVALKENSIKQIYSVIETCQNISVNGCPQTSKYLKSCIDLCWKMGVQERPMHLDIVAETDDDFGKKFDTDKFRAYTRSGRNVAFVVWPALILYEGGPMLAKGIAQGCSGDVKQNNERLP